MNVACVTSSQTGEYSINGGSAGRILVPFFATTLVLLMESYPRQTSNSQFSLYQGVPIDSLCRTIEGLGTSPDSCLCQNPEVFSS